MKAASFLTMAFLAGCSVAYAQSEDKTTNSSPTETPRELKRDNRTALRKLDDKEASYQSKQAFFKDFGNVEVLKWERSDNLDEATFMKDGHQMKAYYDFDSELVGTTSNKLFSDLPVAGQQYIEKHYAGYIKGPVIFFDDNEYSDTDMILYGAQFEDADNYFIELSNDQEHLILQVNPEGNVLFFKKLD